MRQSQHIFNFVDWDNQPVEGTFYQRELPKVDPAADNLFKIEYAIKYIDHGKKKAALVKWKGWPKKFDSWIPASSLVTISKRRK